MARRKIPPGRFPPIAKTSSGVARIGGLPPMLTLLALRSFADAYFSAPKLTTEVNTTAMSISRIQEALTRKRNPYSSGPTCSKYHQRILGRLRSDAARCGGGDWSASARLKSLLFERQELNGNDIENAEVLFLQEVPDREIPHIFLALQIEWSYLVGNTESPTGVDFQQPSRDASLRLLGYVQSQRTLSLAIGHYQSKVSLVIGFCTIALFSLAGLYVAWAGAGAYRPNVKELGDRGNILILAMVCGAIGAFLSLQPRMRPLLAATFRSEGRINLMSVVSGVFLPVVTGAVGGVILYLMFASGLIEGPLFPTVAMLGADGTPVGGWKGVDHFLAVTGPTSSTDAAKLFVWCFVAGFSERLVFSRLQELEATFSTSPQK